MDESLIPSAQSATTEPQVVSALATSLINDDKVILPKIVAKPNYQHQHEIKRKKEVKQHVELQQVWQINARLEKQQEKVGLIKLSPIERVTCSNGKFTLQFNFLRVKSENPLGRLLVKIAKALFICDDLHEKLKQVTAWAHQHPVPKEQSMLNVIHELKSFITNYKTSWEDDEIPVFQKILSHLNCNYLHRSRDKIFQSIFLPIVLLVRENLEPDSSSLLQAIANYDKGEILGEVETHQYAPPLPFSNLQELFDNQERREQRGVLQPYALS